MQKENIEFPAWFHVGCPPVNPETPKDKVQIFNSVKELSFNNFGIVDLSLFPKADGEFTHFDILAEKNSDDAIILRLRFGHYKTINNPHFDYQYAQYQAACKRYEEWYEYKEIYDKHQALKNKEERKQLYENLKKEFENG